jgi:amino acid adenylation domain-containing protein
VTNQAHDIPSFLLAPQQEHAVLHGAVTQAAVRLADGADGEELRSALAAIVARHEILRTTFARVAGLRVPRQVVHDELSPAWTTYTGDDLDRALAAEASALDPENGPVLRAALLEEPAGRTLVLTAPAACLDAFSLPLLLAELAAALRGGGAGEEPLQFADYAEWRRQHAEDDPAGAEAARAWWEDGAPLDRPLLFGRPGDGAATERVEVALTGDVLTAVRTAAADAHVPDAVFLEAALHAVVARATGETELTLAGVADGRAQADLAGAVGPYAQLVPVRTRIEEETTFAELVAQVARSRAESARWQDFASPQQLARAAGTTIAFAQLDATFAADLFPDGAPVRIATQSSTPLELCVVVAGGGARADLLYDAEAYGADDARRLAALFAGLLADAARDPAQRVAALALLGDAEQAGLFALADGGTADAPAWTFVEAFEERAAATPDALAVSDGSARLDYRELDDAANRLAHDLAAAGVEPGGAVGHCLDRSTDAIVALLAILKAGAAFVPLNFEHPPSRLEHQLREVEAQAVVTRSDLLDRLPAFGGPVVCVDRDRERIASRPAGRPGRDAAAGDVAYVMYTSGSTGLPKGVAVTHGNVANYTARLLERLGDVAGLSFAVVSALSTDLGYTSVFPPLAGGGSVQLVPPDVVIDPEAYAAFAAAAPVDVLKITPSLLGALLAGRGADVLPRRVLLCGGEAFTRDLLERIRAAGASCRVVNHYGPTETTIGTCALEVEGELDPAAATVPVGRPFANARVYVVGPDGRLVPPGVPGELWIGGAGVAAGYVNRPDETSERFVHDPFAEGRAYRTGDRARYLRDGSIEFLGRVDAQLKIRGYRVEPGEVEAALQRHPAVRQAAVVPHEDGGEARLVAYVSASPQPPADELRRLAAEWVPEYMVPSFAFLDALPLTASGKIDRKALADLPHAEEDTAGEYVAPRNELEREIASIWEELLGVDRVGVTDDFFALGGHSLLATQMITRIRRLHGEVPLRALFNAPTVSGLAEAVGTAVAVEGA